MVLTRSSNPAGCLERDLGFFRRIAELQGYVARCGGSSIYSYPMEVCQIVSLPWSSTRMLLENIETLREQAGESW